MRFLLVFLSLLFSTLGFTAELATQNTAQNISDNPLSGFTKFAFLPNTPAYGTLLDKINLTFEKELKQIGTTNVKNMLVKTDQGEAIDLSGFDSQAILFYEIKNLTSIDGKELGIVQASLILSTNTSIIETHQKTKSIIWSSNCLIKGDTKKHLANLIKESLPFLLQKFIKDYSKDNSEKPTINLILS